MLSTQPQSICASHRCVWESILALGFKSCKMFYVATLALGLWPKLRHEIKTSWKNVPRFKHTFPSMKKCHEDMRFETLPNEKHFGNCNFMRVSNLWNKIVDSKHGPNWTPMHYLNFFEVLILKVCSHFSFGVVN